MTFTSTPSFSSLLTIKGNDKRKMRDSNPRYPEEGIPDFESSAFGHSANLPKLSGAKVILFLHPTKYLLVFLTKLMFLADDAADADFESVNISIPTAASIYLPRWLPWHLSQLPPRPVDTLGLPRRRRQRHQADWWKPCQAPP